MVDDMITTAGTVADAMKILKKNGVKDIYIAATHAVFAPPAMERLAGGAVHQTGRDRFDLRSATVPTAIKDRLVVLSVAELLGERDREDSLQPKS